MTPCIEHSQGKGKPVYGYVAQGGKVRLMHRDVYRRTHGLSWDDLRGVVIRHKCDNPRCVNPDHLEAGTHKDNVRDAIERGRFVVNLPPPKHGETHPQAKLTLSEVAAIRSSDLPQRAIARLFGISQSHVSRIRLGQSWQ